jgi:ComEC/Rec2-related protein
MKRPLLWPALCFALGVALGEGLGAPLGPLFGGAGLGLLAAGLLPRLRYELLLAVSLVGGWIQHGLHQSSPAPHDLRRQVGTNATFATLRCEIRDTPALKLVERRGQLSGRTLFRVRVYECEQAGLWRPATGDVAVSLKGPVPPEFFRTQRLELRGVLQRPPGPAAPGLFDYATHLRHQGCWFTLLADGPHDWRLAPDSVDAPPLSERFLPWAQTTLARGLPDDEATRLLWAMALGWKTALDGEVDTVFMKSGTMHVFAISGLHIALIAGVIVALLRAARMPRRGCGLVAIPLLWFYVAATGWQTSAIRSALMSTVVIGSWALERPGDLFNSLALALLTVLVWAPGQLFQASFQLSFGVVAGMALLVPLMEPRLLQLLRFDPDPFLPDELRPRWQRWLELPLRRLALLLAASLAAQIASLPLTVHYFNLLNPVSLLANLVVVPLSALTLAANVASLAVGGWWPWLGETFNASAWLWMRGMVWVSRLAAEVPAGVWYVAAPPWPWWIPYFAVVLALTSGWAFREEIRKGFALAVGLVVAAALWAGLQARSQTTLTLLAGGKAMVFDGPARSQDLLVDTGSEAAATALVVPFLHSSGWNSIPQLLVSHGDLQHVGGSEVVLRELPVRTLALAATNARSPAFRQLLTLAAEQCLPLQLAHSGAALAGWDILHPPAGARFARADDTAVVLRRDFGGCRILLLSDLGRLGQQALRERPTELIADIVVAGLPREAEPLQEELLARINPQLVVIASAEYPAPERVKPATRARLRQTGRRLLFTEDCGTLQFHPGPAGMRVTAMDGTTILLPPRSNP